MAIEQLKAAGLAEEAVKLRELSDQLNQRVIRERTELSRQITEFQKQSEQLRRLTGRPEISHRDFKNSVKVNDLTIRRFSTQAEMNLGETLVVSMVSNPGSQGETVDALADTGPPEKTVTPQVAID